MNLAVGRLPHGPKNLITDVLGVRVGHTTVDKGNCHTGVTVVVPPVSNPFTEKLTVFPARNQDIIGDVLLRSQCILPAYVRPDTDTESVPVSDTVLPPLSPDFASALCTFPEGRTLVQHDMLSFSRLESGAVQVTLTLEGGFTLRMRRIYEPMELLSLFAGDIPTVAVWPAVPLPPDKWKLYTVYSHMSAGFSISAQGASAGAAPAMSDNPPRSVMVLEEFPASFSFWQGEQPIGSLINLLPGISLNASEEAMVCMDLGSSAASVILSRGNAYEPLQGPGEGDSRFQETDTENSAAHGGPETDDPQHDRG